LLFIKPNCVGLKKILGGEAAQNADVLHGKYDAVFIYPDAAYLRRLLY